MRDRLSLIRLFAGLDYSCNQGQQILENVRPLDVTQDSRRVGAGSLFFAIRGVARDGNDYVVSALEKGAVGVVLSSTVAVTEEIVSLASTKNAVVIFVDDVRLALAIASARFYDSPSMDLVTVGVTGTNGKTSICWILTESLFRLSCPVIQIGTLGVRMLGDSSDNGASEFTNTNVTTPDQVELARYLALARSKNLKAAVMEVSSHGVDQNRIAGIDFDAAIFTNLTRDHLDYHTAIEDYREAKCRLFTEHLLRSRKSSPCAIINIDDEGGRYILESLRERSDSSGRRRGLEIVTYSALASSQADVCLVSACSSLKGMSLKVILRGVSVELQTQLIGKFNIYNLLACLACLQSFGYSQKNIASVLAEVPRVPGRLERVGEGDVNVFVDYAHTPDALVCAQNALRESMSSGRLITVFGCGGERDRGKRPLMAKAVCELSDYAVVTSDNPRREEPMDIIGDILPGFRARSLRPSFSYDVIEDRKEAIFHAIKRARPGDCVLVAGKGHETYQEVGQEKRSFCDRNVCREALYGHYGCKVIEP